MLAEELALALQPLDGAFDTPGALRDFLAELGWDFDQPPPALETPARAAASRSSRSPAIPTASTRRTRCASSQRAGGVPGDHAARLGCVARERLQERVPAPAGRLPGGRIPCSLPAAPRLRADGARARHPRGTAGSRPASRRTCSAGSRGSGSAQLLHDPQAHLKTVYRWGQSDFDGARLIASARRLCSSAWDLHVSADLLDEPTPRA